MAKALARYLDHIRKSKHISIETLTEDIISTRQYKRYLNGSSDLPYSVFEKLSERLSIDEMYVFNDLDQKANDERDDLDTLYTSIVRFDFDTATEILDKLDYEILSSKNQQLFYNICLALYNYYLKKDTLLNIRNKLMDELDYPAILQHTAFTSTEILGLGSLMSFFKAQERKPIIDLLFNILVGTLTTIGPSKRTTQYVIPRVAKELGIQEEYQKVIEVCEQGLQIADRLQSYLNVDYLHYYTALSYHYIDNQTMRDAHLKKLYHFLEFLGNDHKYKKFDDLVQGDFNTPLSTYQ